MRRLIELSVAIALFTSAMCAAEAASDSDHSSFGRLFSLVGDYPLGSATTRTDYQSIDPASARLYISKMGAGSLLVFDTGKNKLVSEISGFPKITGVLVVPEIRRAFASVPGAGLASSLSVGLGMLGLSSGHGALAILDSTNLHEIVRLSGGIFPDGIAYDPSDRRIFVSDELGSQVLAIDVSTNRLVARIAAGGEVGNVQYDPVTSKVYAPIQTNNELVVIDPAAATIIARRPLTGGEHPHGLAIAPGSSIGYVACDGNNMLLTVDLVSGKILNRQPVARDPDVLAVDWGSKRLYVASESGNLSSFDVKFATEPVSLGEVFVADDAHSVAVDPVSHRLYFPLASLDGHSVMRVLVPR